MVLSRQAFVEGLYSEYLEEASFLYQQRAFLRAKGGLTRRELGRIEQRMKAFLDAAYLGGEATAVLCVQRAEEGEPGDCYVAARLLVRLGLVEPLASWLGQVDVADEERLTALRDGLCHQMPRGVLPQPSQLPVGSHPMVSALLVAALGHARRSEAWVLPWIQQMLGTKQAACVVEATKYLGRVGTHGAVDLLRQCLNVQDTTVKLAAAHALLRLDPVHVVGTLLNPRSFPVWASPLVGLAGGRDAVRRLILLVENDEGGKDSLLALGALGAPVAVPVLIAQLSHVRHAEQAAQALYLLTGADLWEEVVEGEAPDEAELFSDEQGMGEETSLVRRISRKDTDWGIWWNENRIRFDSFPRWRAGRPFSPDVLMGALSAESEARVAQQLAGDELAIRYGIDWGFELDALQSSQALALKNGRAWLEANRPRFIDGRWYLAGRCL